MSSSGEEVSMAESTGNRSGTFIPTPTIVGFGLGLGAVVLLLWGICRALTASEEA